MSGKSRTRRRPTVSTTVPAHEQQIFQFGPFLFDVEAAHRLLRRAPRARCRIPVDEWARLYGLDENPGSFIAPGPDFDPTHAMGTDLNRPVILALLPTDDELGNPILIDGCHRLYKAHRQRMLDPPAYQLTLAETQAIRID